MRESCERMVYNIIIFHLLLKEKIMLFNNMNLFAVFMTSAALSFTSAVFCLSMIAVFEKIGEMIRSRRRLVNVITVDQDGKVTMSK